jgi:hypothetical protein
MLIWQAAKLKTLNVQHSKPVPDKPEPQRHKGHKDFSFFYSSCLCG